MAGRQLPNFIRSYMEYTNETESPEAYHFWSAATLIGAITQRRVFLDFNYFRVYPNFYVILVGPSGARKSSATNVAIEIAAGGGIRKFSDKITGAALIKDLSANPVKFLTGTQINLCSPVLIYASELGVFMGPDAYGSGVIADLTDLYDCPSKWEKKTISRDAETIIAPYVSMLAASTTQTLKDVIPPGAVGQGFTSRILFVWGGGRRQRVPVPEWSVKQDEIKKALVEDLRHIGSLDGNFTFAPDGLRRYREHYLSRPEPEEEFDDERLRGYSSRKDIHILKLAMALSLAERDDLTIIEKDIEAAIDAFRWLDSGLSSVFSGHGIASTSQDVIRIYEQIKKACHANGYATHADIIRKNFAHVDNASIAMILATLKDSGAISEEYQRGQDQVVRRLYKIVDKDFIKTGKSTAPKKVRNI